MGFCVNVAKYFLLTCRSLQERQDWVDALQKAITDNISRQKTFHDVKLSCSENENSAEPFKLGQQVSFIFDKQLYLLFI